MCSVKFREDSALLEVVKGGGRIPGFFESD